MSNDIEHRAFWGLDDDGDIALPYNGWYPLEKIVSAQEGSKLRAEEKKRQMTAAFNGTITEKDLRSIY